MFKSNFKFKSKIQNDYLLCVFSGEFDKSALSENKLEINKTINEFEGKTVIFDFTDLNYINSESIGYLIQLNGYLGSVDKKFVLIGVKKNVKDILNAIGIFEIIPVFSSLDDYLKDK
jgi:stage II sporulation protein AA (anti-sigma F factor antagonist)